MNFYKFALKRMNPYHKALWSTTFLTALTCNIAILVTPIVQKALLQQISEKYLSPSKIIALCLISILSIAALIIESVNQKKVSLNIQRSLQRELLENAIRSDTTSISSRGPGAYMVSLFGDSEHIADLISLNVWNVIFQVLTVIGILVITTTWSPLFIKIVLPAFFLMILSQYLFEKNYMYRFKQGREKVYEINPLVLEYLENKKSIISFANLSAYEKSIYELFDSRDKEFRKASISEALSASVISAIKAASLILLFIFSLFEIKTNTMEISTFIAFVSYMGIVFQPIASIKALISNKNKYNMYYEKISQSLEPTTKIDIPDNNSLMLSNCSFDYGNEEKPISNITLSINNKIGLVGLSGEGKTTLIKLLLGENAPQQGTCTLGTKPTSQISKYVLFSFIRYYSQDVEIFNSSLETNITLHKKSLTKSEYEAAKKDNYTLLSDIINKLKAGKRFPKSPKELTLLKDIFSLNVKQIDDSEIQNLISQKLMNLDQQMITEIANIYIQADNIILRKNTKHLLMTCN